MNTQRKDRVSTWMKGGHLPARERKGTAGFIWEQKNGGICCLSRPVLRILLWWCRKLIGSGSATPPRSALRTRKKSCMNSILNTYLVQNPSTTPEEI